MAWEENLRICLHMQLIAILSRTEALFLLYRVFEIKETDLPFHDL